MDVNTRDSAILAVYQHLLELTDTFDSKMYLSDFYTNCDNWTAQRDYFKDGTGTWHITVDMTAVTEWPLCSYWCSMDFRQQAVAPGVIAKGLLSILDGELSLSDILIEMAFDLLGIAEHHGVEDRISFENAPMVFVHYPSNPPLFIRPFGLQNPIFDYHLGI